MSDLDTSLSRATVVRRLAEDLIGPSHGEELLVSRPSDVYLTAILWPKNTYLDPAEDEKLSVAQGEGEEGEDAADDARPAAIPMLRPSTAGISFAAASMVGSVPTVRVLVRYGLYVPEKIEKGYSWRRRQISPGIIDIPLDGSIPDVTLTDAELGGVRLNVRTAGFAGGILSTITLVNGSTPSKPGRLGIEQSTMFQVDLEIRPAEGSRLVARPSRRAPVDDDDFSAALLYRDAKEFAAGHTCSADWDASPDSDSGQTLMVCAAWLPAVRVPAVSPDGHEVFRKISLGEDSPLSADWLAGASDAELATGLGQLCDAYEIWIEQQKSIGAALTGRLAETASLHLENARHVLSRMRKGIARIVADNAVGRSFRLANRAMTTQRQWGDQPPLKWRPFQLGFVLLALESSLDGEHPDRSVMDLLWFPTGGGKTEAYLALVAMTAFHRRLCRTLPNEGDGVAVIMRYTLRLLTTQQFLRASAVICACEAIRRGTISGVDNSGLGSTPFSIGLWVGDNASPNRRKDAFASRTDDSKASPQQLHRCPCCRRRLDYQQSTADDPVEIYCRTDNCSIGGKTPLPVWTVDDDVYEVRPTLLIGTVDKFAQIVRNGATARLFGVGSGAQPQLILQDELHLISGPLGTLTGLYEAAIDLILSNDGSKPKIIGSTATIRRASEQVLALFDRETCQFPPSGTDASDSGFAVLDTSEKAPGRWYVGVTTAGRSAKFTLQAVTASLLQSGAAGLPEEQRDHYWTLVTYFNSLRELGGALVLMQDDVNDTLKLLAEARNEPVRRPSNVEELTSRRSQQEIGAMLTQLEIPAGEDGTLDVVLATNMVSVGVDISRLGLMVVNGQPKTMAEYIQATSRVGRSTVAGLVVPILNGSKPRDRSHFETFRTWHATLYREVEATSVTPFASRARDRALHAVLVAVVRHLAPGMLNTPELSDEARDIADILVDRIAERAKRIDRLETDVRDELLDRLRKWIRRKPRYYWSKKAPSLLQAAEQAAAKRAAGRAVGQAWPTPNSMRGVEPATPFRLTERLRQRNG